jgi:hypothetical protein
LMVFWFLLYGGILIYCASSSTEYPKEADPLPRDFA